MSRAPEKIVLMSADGFWQSVFWSEEIDCRCLAIVSAVDRGSLLFFRRQRMIDARHSLDETRPRKFISVILRQRLTNKAPLCFGNFKRKVRLVTNKRFYRQHRQNQRQQRQDTKHQPKETRRSQDRL